MSPGGQSSLRMQCKLEAALSTCKAFWAGKAALRKLPVANTRLALQVDKYQADLDRLTSTLKQIELYNEEMKSEIAVTRRWVPWAGAPMSGPVRALLVIEAGESPGLGLILHVTVSLRLPRWSHPGPECSTE